MNLTEPALGRRRCAGDGAPKARWCTLAASAQCLHESRRRVGMDLCCWRVGFSCGLFPPMWCFPPRCLGAAPLRFFCRAWLLLFCV